MPSDDRPAPSAGNELDGWVSSEFSAAGFTRPVLRRGSGPGVIVIHEVPGVTPNVARFANEVVERGFSVAMPSLVGEPGRGVSIGYLARTFGKLCVAGEFAAWAAGRTAPIVEFLRALAADLHREAGGRGVGAVGMCFSGGFALGMMLDDRMLAPVLSQPSLPLPVGRRRAGDLQLSPADLDVVVRRAREGCPVMGLRFASDRAVGTRFDTLHRLLGDAFIDVSLPSSKRTDHSVLTEQRHDPSVARVLDFLAERLL